MPHKLCRDILLPPSAPQQREQMVVGAKRIHWKQR